MWILKMRRLARKAGREALILFFAVRHPDTPLPLKIAAGAALAYLLSPVDLIPDVPLVGFVDDLLVLSVGVPMLVGRLPPSVVAEAGARADKVLTALGFQKAGAAGSAGRQRDAEVEVEIGEPVRRSSRSAAGSGAARPRAARRPAAGGVNDAKVVSEARRPARKRGGGSAAD
ncbi:YkvA family protein [Quisquiliibacterium transsilvanicum]|uniref:Uncharacterized membrane protein YkvA (DUF1232 family) n=1 Tax=Quisquiliibacterium transsilvanicum TaxID=1549638 RepID=A0A7W8MAD6_9BURK|nr:DUF1232 domain-containing protein [Quisquiliibacterium transsilvanicum]MBB5273838.1 uncharacterized membrane protein YkvA (DUF1232 family) [Quisquiliibacterium transsilvanicum]